MRSDISYWVALSRIQGLGRVPVKNLLDRFGSPEAIFSAKMKDLADVDGLDGRTARAVVGFAEWEDIEKDVLLAHNTRVSIVTFGSPGYPKRLGEVHDPPAVLYIRGAVRDDDACLIAVVGSRQPTEYGRIIAEKMAEGLAAYGAIVVSGMARGIDSIAHRACLRAGGRTVAVLGSGIDNVYPPEHKELCAEIAGHGAVVSEFPFGTPPLARNFPRRNRVISGMSYGVLVVEATMRSGSLITARFALDQGREVFAVPGNVLSPKSQGTNNLIKQGAKPVDTVEEILEDIRPQMGGAAAYRKPSSSLSCEEKRIYDFLEIEPKDIDSIIQGCGMHSAQASVVLMGLELAGLVKQLPGKRFMRAE